MSTTPSSPTPTSPGTPSPQAEPSVAATDFARDAGSSTLRETVKDYFVRVRSGDTGALPAIVGLLVLCLLFGFTKSTFVTDLNFANLLTQATWLIILAMGVTFVLLLGEIDLAAGATMGVTGAIIYIRTNDGMSAATNVIIGVVFGGLLAAFVFTRIRQLAATPAVAAAIGLAAGAVAGTLLATVAPNTMRAVALGLVVGLAMGTFTGLLVAKVGIPSFVVTLALFLGWQGLLLKIAKQGGSIRVDDKFLSTIGTGSMSPTLGWVLFAIVVASYAILSLTTRYSRVRKGVSSQPLSVIAAKAACLTAGWGFATWRLNQDRSTRNATAAVMGVPWVVPLVLGITVVLTFLLARTAWGRHMYAVGGNDEAARRAGINVSRVKLSAFALVGVLATIAGLAYGSRVGSITPQTGAGSELLRAVGAAVVGGVSLFGGKGKVAYAVVGGLVLAVIDNGLGLYQTILGIDVDAGVKLMVASAVLLLAGSFDALTRRGARAGH